MSSSMVVNDDGSVTATVTVRFTGAIDALDTGTATLTITPDGGISSLSALLDGDPGQPANFRNVTVQMLDPTATGSATATQVSPGGPGVASVYDLALSLPRGAKGDTGATGSVLNSSDINNSPADDNVLSFDAASGKGLWVVNAPVLPYFVVPASAFSVLTGTSATASGVLVSLQIPGQPFRWRPFVSGACDITSAADTPVGTEVRMGPTTQSAAQISQSGTLIGRGRAQASSTVFGVATGPFFGVAMNPTDTSPAATVPAGTAQTIAFSALRQSGTSPWSVAAAGAEFRVKLEAV